MVLLRLRVPPIRTAQLPPHLTENTPSLSNVCLKGRVLVTMPFPTGLRFIRACMLLLPVILRSSTLAGTPPDEHSTVQLSFHLRVRVTGPLFQLTGILGVQKRVELEDSVAEAPLGLVTEE